MDTSLSQAIARFDLDLAAVLLEIGNSVGLEQNLHIRMFAALAARSRLGDSMLAHLDLAEFQPRDGDVVDPPFERRSLERIDIELAARDQSAYLTNTGSASSGPIRLC